ncbi:hypothetical protein [Burkholderia contaminans]|uniref:hypothetical protein n=1 Tax=Burkholderia contaminans TaxID=488447 RepID=UPI000F56E130|nr:hypothetical protein [Burkholderia contaminans]RQT38615.1 hypothetical protein DF036_08180 [Burkholderia contaminans]
MLPAAFRDGYPRQVRCGRLLLQVTGAGADAPVLTIAKQGIGVSGEGLRWSTAKHGVSVSAEALTLVDRRFHRVAYVSNNKGPSAHEAARIARREAPQ